MKQIKYPLLFDSLTWGTFHFWIWSGPSTCKLLNPKKPTQCIIIWISTLKYTKAKNRFPFREIQWNGKGRVKGASPIAVLFTSGRNGNIFYSTLPIDFTGFSLDNNSPKPLDNIGVFPRQWRHCVDSPWKLIEQWKDLCWCWWRSSSFIFCSKKLLPDLVTPSSQLLFLQWQNWHETLSETFIRWVSRTEGGVMTDRRTS